MTTTLFMVLALSLAVPGESVRERTADDHARLAAWCQERGHEAKAKEQARAALRLDKDHAQARRVLGFIRVEGRWARVTPPRDFREKLKEQVEADFARLVSKDAQERDRAREALVETANLEDLPELATEAARLHAAAARFWKRAPRAVLELRGTSSRLVSNRSFRTSLGTGSPVTLQLPELRGVRIGTSVGVPLGGP